MTASAASEIEALKQLKARYFRLMDTKQWGPYRDVFAEDAVIGPLDTGMPGAVAEKLSADEFISNAERSLADVTTVHHGHMPELELMSESSARGIWAMDDLLEFPEGASPRRLHGYGHYHETYTKADGAWRIQSMQITRLHVQLDEA